MNHTLIQPQILAKIKKLNREIESLRDVYHCVGLTPKQQLKLENKENKLTKLLNKL